MTKEEYNDKIDEIICLLEQTKLKANQEVYGHAVILSGKAFGTLRRLRYLVRKHRLNEIRFFN